MSETIFNPPLEEAEDFLAHVGVKYRSGRYPYGSGENPYQHDGSFLWRYNKTKEEVGDDEKAIAKALNTTTTKLRIQLKYAKHQAREWDYHRAVSLKEDGLNTSEIARRMGYPNESSIRSLLDERVRARKNVAAETADKLKSLVDKYGIVDIGKGQEANLGISKGQLDEAAYMLEVDGYHIYGGRVPQQNNPGKMIIIRTLAKPEKEHKEIFDYKNVHSLDESDEISYDGGKTFKPAFHYPESLDSKRVAVKYREDGGADMDGVIEIRPGVEDLSMGNAHYAQVRILVDGTHYIKGMAIYSNDLPDGVDVRVNSNKKRGTPLKGTDNEYSVLKKIKTEDPNNPFGALIKPRGGQTWYGENNDKLGVINKTREEGEWSEWADTLPSQFLSKQKQDLIDNQLKLTKEDARNELNDIMKLTNPTVKKQFLMKYADEADAAAVELKAASLPRQKYQVILPLDIPDNQVYAPNYENGEKVALVRFPHGGTFEIPILTVNNKLKAGKDRYGNRPLDAIGISPKVAEQLSGADFDGDTVMVIPTNDKIKITNKEPLAELVNFDPKLEYGGRPEGTYKRMTKRNTQMEMGKISNLITDMTIAGAPDDEIARAVKHSMVVIDAEKHHLDYQASEIDNRIKELKQKWQPKENGRYGGAATLISRSTSETHPLKTTGFENVDPNTGRKSWKEMDYIDPKTGKQVHRKSKEVEETYLHIDIRDPETGKWKKANPNEKAEYYKAVKRGDDVSNYRAKEVIRTRDSTQMADTDDARTLISKHNSKVEQAYADYANYMKALANEARKAYYAVEEKSYDREANQRYSEEIADLDAKLLLAEKNRPKERQANLLASADVKALVHENPDMSEKDKGKIGQQRLTYYRQLLGAARVSITLTDKQWEAIQAGAVSPTKLKKILGHVDEDDLRQRALPKETTKLSTVKKQKIDSMMAFGYTQAQVAKALGISSSTVNNYLKGKDV